MEEKNKKNSQKLAFLLVICTFIGTIMLVFGVYSLLKGNNEKPVDNEEKSISPSIKELREIDLSNVNQDIIINGSKLTLRSSDGILYINDKASNYDDIEHSSVYFTGDVVLLFSHNQCGESIESMIDAKGSIIKAKLNYNPSDYYIVTDSLKVVDNKVVAKLESFSEFFACEVEPCANPIPQYDVEFSYDNINLNVNKIN